MTVQENREHSEGDDFRERARQAAFNIEHALNMYAENFCALPAEWIYNEEALASVADVTQTCHIYLIGYTPRIEFVDATQQDRILLVEFDVQGSRHFVPLDIPEGLTLVRDEEYWRLEAPDGTWFFPSQQDMNSALSAQIGVPRFEVKYVGQAYGKDRSRNAIDRLLKHETLQKIAVKGAPEGHRLALILLSVQTDTRVVTLINPHARETAQGDSRIRAGLNKLFNTTEAERISLYEAALIRYFYPEFNKEFKDSFPSTNLKILQDCYDKDFSAVIAEICIDDLPFRLWSAAVEPKAYHIAKHHLHASEDRRMFFGLR